MGIKKPIIVFLYTHPLGLNLKTILKLSLLKLSVNHFQKLSIK